MPNPAKQYEDIKELQDTLVEYNDAQRLNDDARRINAANQAIEILSDLNGTKIRLSADPAKIAQALDGISPAAQLEAHGLLNDPVLRQLLGMPPVDPISPVAKKFNDSKDAASPIILDLDGDGVETINIDSSYAYFDFDSNGFAQKTGWIGADDGFLARDLNGNGLIDTGKELFGNHTALLDGTNAENGFEALKEIDSNNDGIVNASDSGFATLRVWKDLNQDGLTNEGELFNLDSVGVKSISVSYVNNSSHLPDSNENRQIGSYITTDNQTRAAYDVWFQTSNLYTYATTAVTISEEIELLPNARGYGKVHDLHQAMVRDSSGVLINLVTQFVSETSVLERNNLLESIIYKWTGVVDVDPQSRTGSDPWRVLDSRKLEALEEFMGEEWTETWSGQNSSNPGNLGAKALLNSWQSLFDLVYGQLARQSFLKELFSSITLEWDESSQSLKGDLSLVATHFITAINNNRSEAKQELANFLRALKGLGILENMNMAPFSAALIPLGLDIASILNIDTGVVGDDGANLITLENDKYSLQGLGGNDSLRGNDGDNFIDGDIGNDQLEGLGGDDILFGGEGNDHLHGGDGNDLIEGQDGNDFVFGEIGNDLLNGGDGDDDLRGDEGNDTLNGNAGIDALHGGVGNDTYLISRGTEQDIIYELSGVDSILFDADVASIDVSFWRDSSNLYLGINGTSDIVTISQWFADTTSRVENIIFSDGTVWTGSFLQTAIYKGSETSDYITGTEANDIIRGLGGDDSLFGYEGHDTLEGGVGNDFLIGDLGNDILDGGAGNDSLSGDAGNDIYLLSRGSGQDLVYEAAGTDSIQLASDILPSDVEIWRDASNLYLGILGTTDVMNIAGWFDDSMFRVESIKFADGTIWGTSVMTAAKFKGTEGNDSISGTTSGDQIFGMGGNDSLFGDAGNDTLDGGVGNDNLSGYAGNDIYLFGSGDGQDIVTEISGSTDILRFKSGVTQSDILVSRDNTHLYFSIISTGDKITIQNHFSGDTNARIERVEFNDGSSWDLTAINAKMSTTSTGDDFFWGTTGNDVVNGLDGNDQLIGNAGNDTLTGSAGNDLLDGGLGNDSMSGGSGDDIYIVDSASDVVTENTNEGTDLVNSSITYILGANLENLTLTGSAVINGTGNILNNILIGNDQVNQLVGDLGDDTLIGGAGNDNLNGGAGADNLLGGLGNDTYVIDSEDVVTELAGEGTDTIQAGFNYTLGDNLENLTLTGSATDGTGNTLNNSLVGNSAANLLIGLAGNDTLNGGTSADTMIGGIGNDTYTVDNIGDVVTEFANEGTDTVNSSISYVLADTLENLTLSGSAAINGTGNAFNNVITGNSGANTLNGGNGNDSLNGGTGTDKLIGGLGNDTYTVDNIGDLVTENADEGIDTVSSSITYTLGNNLENLTLTGTTAINGTGNSLDNILIGNTVVNLLTGGAGNDTLDGGIGADSLVGGLGNDTYIVDNASDVITEAVNEGIDIVNSSVTFTLSSNVENLTLTGNSAINATGNTLANTLIGNSSINILNGGTGADTLIGAAGDDTYVVDDAGDLVIESVAQGTDLVQSSISYSLTDNVENLTLTGTAANNASGNTLNNTLTGNSGSNILNGGEGADTMIGAAGNDTYIVDNIGDVITEGSSGGTDSVQSSVTYSLASNVEHLTLNGTSAINATGNTLANTLTGNEAANTLDGGTGADTMLGGNGDDIYVVDNVGDVVTENINEGIDLVQSKITFTLGNNFENLTLTGSTAINGTGNSSDNVLTGNSAVNTLTGGDGNDVLNGAGGADILIGGAGNDVYVVDNANDQVTEVSNEGVDTVNASVTHTLAANVENLTLTGTGNISGTGNALDNILIGTTGNNTLTANDGNDRLDGGAGNDTMNGGLNNDTYIFGRGYAVDTIVENDPSVDDQDVVQFGSDIATDQLWFRHVGNNLEATIVGTNDKLVISNWYLGDAYRVEQFVTADGSILLDTQVEALVSAMAGFAPPVGVGSIISQEVRDQLQPVLAASWN